MRLFRVRYMGVAEFESYILASNVEEADEEFQKAMIRSEILDEESIDSGDYEIDEVVVENLAFTKHGGYLHLDDSLKAE